jgi:hypothetical protein
LKAQKYLWQNIIKTKKLLDFADNASVYSLSGAKWREVADSIQNEASLGPLVD